MTSSESTVSKKESRTQVVIIKCQLLGMIGGYRFAGNSYEIFEKFFGSQNPFTDRLEDDGRD